MQRVGARGARETGGMVKDLAAAERALEAIRAGI
jgi:hypothetical protein